MNKEELYNTIENYLNDQLMADELRKFEARLNSDMEFAQEVTLHKRLQEGMGDPQKRMLRESLDTMREEFKNTEAEDEEDIKVVSMSSYRQQRIMWMAAASILLIGLTWWFFVRNPIEKNELVQQPADKTQEQIVPENDKAPIEDKVIPVPKDKEEYVNKAPQRNEDPDPIEEKAPIENTPQIDYFKPNTELASLIDNIKSQKIHKFNIHVPAGNETYSVNNGNVALYFKGELESFDFPEKESFNLAVYDNQPESFKNGNTVFKTEMSFTKEEVLGFGAEGFSFEIGKSIKLRPGAYCYLIRLSNQDEVLAGGCFMVKQ